MFKHSVRVVVCAVLFFFSLLSFAAVSMNPHVIKLVEVSSIEKGTLTLSWLPTHDDNTASEQLRYSVYVSPLADFLPGPATLKATLTGEVSATIKGLLAGKRYFVMVTATDADGNISWSNKLEGNTVAINAKRTATNVHSLPSGQTRQSRIALRSAKTIVAGDYLVDAEQGGYLRKVTQAKTANGETIADTQPAALNKVFSELALSTTIKIQDIPAQPVTHARLSSKANTVTWQDTGLTLSSSEMTASPMTASPMTASPMTASPMTASPLRTGSHPNIHARRPAIKDNQQTENGRNFSITAPASVSAQPNINTSWAVRFNITNSNMALCDYGLVSFTHPSGKISSTMPQRSTSPDRIWLTWTASADDVDNRPYSATVKVKVCHKTAIWTEEKQVTIPVYVTQGTPDANAVDISINFSEGAFNVEDQISYDIKPELIIGATISNAQLQTADLKIKADLSFANKLTLTSDGKANLTQRKKLVEKSFIKVFMAGGVPIVVSGTFKIDAEVVANVSGKAKLEKLLELKFPNTQFGLEYRKDQSPRWQVNKESSPAYTFQIKGEADAHADITLKLIPDMQVSFYDVATGRLIVEPYVYAQADLHGQLNYLNTNNGAPLTDLDYWFTDLQADVGADMRLYAGLAIFGYPVKTYPNDGIKIEETDKYKTEKPLLKRTSMAQLPVLTADAYEPTLVPDGSDSRIMLIQGRAKNYVAPLLNSALIKFDKWTAPTLLSLTDGAQLIPRTDLDGAYWFTYRNTGTYTVRLAGYTNLGQWVRQVAETTITLTDADNDGMIDQWEQRYGLFEANADDDQDGVSNVLEFTNGTDPKNAASAPLVLSGTFSNKQVNLKWNAVKDAAYVLCYATQAIADVNNCQNYAGGKFVTVTAGATQATVTKLVNGKTYYFRVMAENNEQTLGVSNLLTATPNKPTTLNDTGITTCSNGSQNNLPCPVADYPNQDAQSGRDVTQNNANDGRAGFNFVKISSTGAALPTSATSWNCVKDNVTGLMWEIKTTDNTLHDQDWTYSWYEPNNTKNGGSAGYQNGGSCGSSSSCDTAGYVQAVNAAGWCGYKDWRLPTVEELSGIASLDRYYPSIDTTYFPNTQSSWFWSSSPVAHDRDDAWIVQFYYGSDGWYRKDNGNFVRLVR